MRASTFRPVAAAPLCALTSPTRAADPGRFWNLAGETISSLTLAPVGTNQFGANQCVNDKDGTMDNDERLRLTDIAPGRYDARLRFQRSNRQCTVHDVEVKDGSKVAFSLEPRDLMDCR